MMMRGTKTTPSKNAATAVPHHDHRRQELVLLGIVLLGIVLFFTGYGVGEHDTTFRTDWVKPLRGTIVAPKAVGTIQGGSIDATGNTPILITVRGLPLQHAGERYALYLTRDGKPTSPCGEFAAGEKTTQVRLSTPMLWKRFDGWEVVRIRNGKPDLERPLLRTTRI
jgi:hypothetical protein